MKKIFLTIALLITLLSSAQFNVGNTDRQKVQVLELDPVTKILSFKIENDILRTVDLTALVGSASGTDSQTITDFSLTGTVLSISLENGNTQNVELASLQGATATNIIAGNNTTVTGTGTPADPFVISAIAGGNGVVVDSINISSNPTTSTAISNAIGLLNVRNSYLQGVSVKTQFNSLNVDTAEDFIISKKHGNISGNNVLLVKDVATGYFSDIFKAPNNRYFLQFVTNGTSELLSFHINTTPLSITVAGYTAYSILNDAGYTSLNNTDTTEATAYFSLNATGGTSLPTGGTAGQVLAKVDGEDYNLEWVNPVSGGAADGNDFLTSVTRSGDVFTFNVANQSNATYDFGSWLDSKNYLTDVNWSDIIGKPTIPTNNNQLTNGAGYITTDTNTQLSQEQVQDYVGSMVTGNTESGITVTYDDAANKFDFTVTGGSTGTDDQTASEVPFDGYNGPISAASGLDVDRIVGGSNVQVAIQTVLSNLYSEGTFTPIAQGVNYAGSGTVYSTYSTSNSSGEYKRVGNVAYVNISFQNVNTTGRTNTVEELVLGNLPFNVGKVYSFDVLLMQSILGNSFTTSELKLIENTNTDKLTVGIADNSGDYTHKPVQDTSIANIKLSIVYEIR